MSKKNSLAFVSTGYLALQQKYIIKVSEEYRQKGYRQKVAIVTCNLFDGHFSSLLGPRLVGQHLHKSLDNLHFFDWSPFLSEVRANELIEQLNNYTTVLWDFPDIDYLKKHEHDFMAFFPYIYGVNILSYNNQNLSREKFESEARAYFSSHGLPLETSEKSCSTLLAVTNYILKGLGIGKEKQTETESKRSVTL